MTSITESYRSKQADGSFSEDTYFATRTDYVYLYGEDGSKQKSLKKELLDIEAKFVVLENFASQLAGHLNIQKDEDGNINDINSRLKSLETLLENQEVLIAGLEARIAALEAAQEGTETE